MDNTFPALPKKPWVPKRHLDSRVAAILRRGRSSRTFDGDPRRLRRSLKSLRTVAESTGVSASHICNLEGGHRLPSTTVAERLIAAYRLTGADAEAVRAVAVPGVGQDRRRQT